MSLVERVRGHLTAGGAVPWYATSPPGPQDHPFCWQHLARLLCVEVVKRSSWLTSLHQDGSKQAGKD